MVKENRYLLSRIFMVLDCVKSEIINTYKNKQAWKTVVGYFLFNIALLFVSIIAFAFVRSGNGQTDMVASIVLLGGLIIALFAFIIFRSVLWLIVLAKEDEEYKSLKILHLVNIAMHNLGSLTIFFIVDLLVAIVVYLSGVGIIPYWLWYLVTIMVEPLILGGNNVVSSIKKSWSFVKNNIAEVVTVMAAVLFVWFSLMFMLWVTYSLLSGGVEGMNYGVGNVVLSTLSIIKSVVLLIVIGFYLSSLHVLSVFFYSLLFKVYKSFYQEKSGMLIRSINGKHKQKMYYVFMVSLSLYIALVLFIFAKKIFGL